MQQTLALILSPDTMQLVVFPAINLACGVVGLLAPIAHYWKFKHWARGGATEWLLLPTLYAVIIYSLYFGGVVAETSVFLRPIFALFLLAPAIPSLLHYREILECRKNSNRY